MDPLPENVSGEVVEKQSHSFEHRINWGHIALAIAAIFVVSRVASSSRSRSSEGNDEGDGGYTRW